MKILQGDCREKLRELEENSVHCCVTSPPYWGLRDYKIAPQVWGGDSAHDHVWNLQKIATEVGKGNWAQGTNGRGELQLGGVDAKREPIRGEVKTGFCECGAWLGCFGLEPTPELYVEHAVAIFREVRRVLRDDGTLWLNIGDSYCSQGGPQAAQTKWQVEGASDGQNGGKSRAPVSGLKPKDLVGIPWALAFALRVDGWYLRQEIIWAKPNPLPESVTDRCTKSHESLFLLSKSAKYYFDHEAIKEPSVMKPQNRFTKREDHPKGDAGRGAYCRPEGGGTLSWKGSEFHTGKTAEHQLGRASKNRSHEGVTEYEGSSTEEHRTKAGLLKISEIAYPTRNKRDVWTIATSPFKEAHFATFPPKLIEPCVLAGCPEGGTVLDPFFGSGTTGVVALRHKRDIIGIDLNPEYIEIAKSRLLKEVLL